MRSCFGCVYLSLILVTSSVAGQNLSVTSDTTTVPNLCDIQTGNTNKGVDLLLQSFKSKLPSRVNLKSFDEKLAHSCFLTGLDSGLSRHGDALLEMTDAKATFTFGLSSGRITIQCSWKYKLGFTLSGTVKAFTNKVSARAKISMNFAPGAHPTLEEFKVTELNKIKTDVSGLSVLNWIGEKILNREVNGARDRIIKEMEVNVYEKLQEKLTTFSLPTL